MAVLFFQMPEREEKLENVTRNSSFALMANGQIWAHLFRISNKKIENYLIQLFSYYCLHFEKLVTIPGLSSRGIFDIILFLFSSSPKHYKVACCDPRQFSRQFFSCFVWLSLEIYFNVTYLFWYSLSNHYFRMNGAIRTCFFNETNRVFNFRIFSFKRLHFICNWFYHLFNPLQGVPREANTV